LTTVRILLAVVVALGCQRPPPHLVVILIDTLRADRLGCYGSDRGLTPFLDSLAARGHVFRRAYAQSAHTRPSVASLMTSRFESQHGVLSIHESLSPDEVMLAGVLQAHGYATAGFSASIVVAHANFGRGFDDWNAFPNLRTSELGRKPVPVRAGFVNQAATSWVRRTLRARPGTPLFLYLHYMEAHPPYGPLPRAVADRRHVVTEDILTASGAYMTDRRTSDDVAGVQRVYDAEIAALDEALRDLFARLAELHVLDHAVVVVTADHGEGFLEHGLFGHGNSLYDELVHVPLLVVHDGSHGRRDELRLTSLIDVAPTFLDLAGIPAEPRFQGHSFRALLADGTARADGPSTAYTELLHDDGPPVHRRAVIAGQGKLLLRTDGATELYDLAADPGETVPWQAPADERRALGRTLADAAAAAGAGAVTAPDAPLDGEMRENLRALGYVN
jgi:arylsulfatase A-like enzyme